MIVEDAIYVIYRSFYIIVLYFLTSKLNLINIPIKREA